MKNIWKSLTALVGVAALSITASMAQDSGALVDALVKKGVLTDQEAEEIRADLIKEYNTSSAGKLQIDSFIKSLTFYGDVRYRYEYDGRGSTSGTAATGGNAPYQVRDRNRLRVRLGAEFQFTDNFVAGVRIATGPGANSTNDDLGNVNTNGQSTGAFGEDANSAMHIDLAYLTYNKAFGEDWLSFTAGKQLLGQKFVQGWTWDSDINPEGGLEKFGDFKIGDGFYVNATAGQYIYGGITTDNPFGTTSGAGASGDDIWMFVDQVTIGWKNDKGYKVEVTPGFVNFAGSTKANNGKVGLYGPGSATATGAYFTAANPNPVGLNVFTTNVTFEHPLPWDMKGKLYADYGANFSGKYRADQLSVLGYTTPNPVGMATPTAAAFEGGASGYGNRNQFAIVGYQFGKGKGKGSWTLDTTFAYQEAYSWDPNLTDSDWNAGQLNGVGFGIKPTYNFTDFLSASLNWRHSTDIVDYTQNKSGAIPGFDVQNGKQNNKTDLVQLDLIWKF